jgi:outer membrane protein assembly factor BamD (BamD/ComL family)
MRVPAMKKILLILACCLCLGLTPPGSSVKNPDPGQETVQGSSGVPTDEGEAKKLLDEAKAHLNEGKYQEAKELAEKVKKSTFKVQATEAEKLLSDLDAGEEAKGSMDIARRYLDAGENDKAIPMIEAIIKKPPKDPKIRNAALSLLKEALEKKTEFTNRQQKLDIDIANTIFILT